MLQFYFLSVLLNIGVGLILVYAADYSKDISVDGAGKAADDDDLFDDENQGKLKTKKISFESDSLFFNVGGFRFVFGVLTVFTGIMKLLSVVRNDIPVVGDFLPAVAGLVGGFTILLEYYRMSTTSEIVLPEPVEHIFIDGRKYIGIFCILVGLLHFLFPQVLLL